MRFDEVVSLMAHQWEQVRSHIVGLTIQVKPKFAKQKKTGLIDTWLLKIRVVQKEIGRVRTQAQPLIVPRH